MRTGHCAWPCHSFSFSDHACDHPSCHKTCCSSCPCCLVEGDCDANRLDDDSQIVNHPGRVSCFNDGRDIYDCNVDGSLIHGYVQQEAESFSFPLAAYPWRSS